MAPPKQQPGLSKQDYQTPKVFLAAVKAKLGIIDFAWDLAADASNSVSPYGYFDEEKDALVQTWADVVGLASQYMWLNPPYSDITKWAKKCWEESQHGANIALLVPASTGSNWFRDYIHQEAFVLYLNGRISFIPNKPYPKDCMLVLYNGWAVGSDIWTWKKDT